MITKLDEDKMDTGENIMALRQATMSGDINFLELQRQAGNNLDTVKYGGWTLLHTAVWVGQVEVASYLLSQGLDPREQDLAGSTSLHLAARQGHKEVVKMILKYGGCDSLNERGANGSSPLHLAVRQGHAETVLLLLQHGARLDIKDLSGRTPLDWACKSKHSYISLLCSVSSSRK